ncbi:transposase [Streptomyces sp. NPDC001153]
MAALETGRTSWTAVLDAVRLDPGADVAAVTAVQLREVVERLVAAGQWKQGDPNVLVVLDAEYDPPRIAHLLGDLPPFAMPELYEPRLPLLAPTAPTAGRPAALQHDRSRLGA